MKRLSLKVLVPLILFPLVFGILLTFLAERLTERILLDYFFQRGIEVGRFINREFYERYFNPRYEIEKEAFNPLDPLEELDKVIQGTMRHFQVERVNFFSQTGQVIYSTEKALMGEDGSSVPQVQKALRGQVISQVVYGARPDRLHGKAGTLLNHDVIEIHLPMICLNEKLPNYGKQVGVVEIYQNINEVRQWLNHLRFCLGGMLSLILVILIISTSSVLYLVVLRPIRRMVDTITDPHSVVDGKLVKQIEGGGASELQGLANSFNQMVEAVVEEESRQIDDAREMAMVDELTSLYNHRYFLLRLEEELARSDRAQSEVSLIFCDLDGLKELNDTKGHQAGDVGLKELARLILDSKRASDVACRYGGDEFVLILPGIGSNEAGVLAERLRAKVQERFQGNRKEWGEGLTLSIGIASYPRDASETGLLIEKADCAMYYAKRHGKNKVQVFDPSEPADLSLAPFFLPPSRSARPLSVRSL